MEAEESTAAESDNIEMHLKIKKCIEQIPTSDFHGNFDLSSGILHKVYSAVLDIILRLLSCG